MFFLFKAYFVFAAAGELLGPYFLVLQLSYLAFDCLAFRVQLAYLPAQRVLLFLVQLLVLSFRV
ncbi:MAG: hypothetical protein NTW59_05035, partial [Candidatus Diapherotrites archaeon]|nr:hypothetical protein [Candidatus Diapherotrites archaeon]